MLEFADMFEYSVIQRLWKQLTHLCRMNSSTSTLWTGPFQAKGMSGYYFLIPCFIEIPVLNAV